MDSFLACALAGVKRVLGPDERIAYAIVFGSTARGSGHGRSDVDVAVGLRDGTILARRARDRSCARLSRELDRSVDLVLTTEAPVALAFRIFSEGVTAVEHDRAVLVRDRANAIVAYLDFRPVEARCTEGVLAAARHGR